jgi:hypothetical protein
MTKMIHQASRKIRDISDADVERRISQGWQLVEQTVDTSPSKNSKTVSVEEPVELTLVDIPSAKEEDKPTNEE